MTARRKTILLRVAIALAVLATIAANAPKLMLFGWQASSIFPASGIPDPTAASTAAVVLSGDMGLRFGLSGDIAKALAAHGIPVTGISSPVAFAHHLDRAQTVEVVRNAIDEAFAQSGAHKVILVGQSFGADIAATVLPDLPRRQRDRIAGVVLVVPSNNVHFRADPTGIAYMGEPDARPAAALRLIAAPPVTCIRGADEAESLCPLLGRNDPGIVTLPGNHYLRHDAPRVLRTILSAVDRMTGTV